MRKFYELGGSDVAARPGDEAAHTDGNGSGGNAR